MAVAASLSEGFCGDAMAGSFAAAFPELEAPPPTAGAALAVGFAATFGSLSLPAAGFGPIA
jgi:hypothetical protein